MKYFTDPALTCLRRLELLDQMFPSQKAEFRPILRDTMHAIPRVSIPTALAPWTHLHGQYNYLPLRPMSTISDRVTGNEGSMIDIVALLNQIDSRVKYSSADGQKGLKSSEWQ